MIHAGRSIRWGPRSRARRPAMAGHSGGSGKTAKQSPSTFCASKSGPKCRQPAAETGYQPSVRPARHGCRLTPPSRRGVLFQPDHSLTFGCPVLGATHLIHCVPRTLNGAAMRAAPAWVGALWRLVVACVTFVVNIYDINILHRCESAYRGAGRRCPAYPPGGNGGGIRAKMPGVKRVLQRQNGQTQGRRAFSAC